MALIACKGCGKSLSSNARICPDCGTLPRVRQPQTSHLRPCRSCGAMLAKANHFYVQQEPTGGYSGTTIGGRTTLTPDSYEHHVHVPCPHCGERKPMVWTLGKTFYRLVGIPAGAFLFLYALGHLGRHLNWW